MGVSRPGSRVEVAQFMVVPCKQLTLFDADLTLIDDLVAGNTQAGSIRDDEQGDHPDSATIKR